MPRMPVALVSATLLVLLAASPAAAHGKPDRVVFTEPDVFQIDGACEFVGRLARTTSPACRS